MKSLCWMPESDSGAAWLRKHNTNLQNAKKPKEWYAHSYDFPMAFYHVALSGD